MKQFSLGAIGEQLVAYYLSTKGCKILHTNYRIGHKEIDIIAAYKQYILFVEVRSRVNHRYQDSVVSDRKMHNIIAAAMQILPKFNIQNAFVLGYLVDIRDKQSIFNISQIYKTSFSL